MSEYYWEDNENDGIPDDEALLDAAAANPSTSSNEIHDALVSLIGLIQLVINHPALPPDIKDSILRSHRYADARSVAKTYL